MVRVEVSLIDKVNKSQKYLATLHLLSIPCVGDFITLDNKNETNINGIFNVEYRFFGDNGNVEIFVSKCKQNSFDTIIFQ